MSLFDYQSQIDAYNQILFGKIEHNTKASGVSHLYSHIDLLWDGVISIDNSSA